MQNLDGYELLWNLSGGVNNTLPLNTTGTTYTVPIPVNRVLQFSIDAVWTSTASPVATLTMEVCDTLSPKYNGPTLPPEFNAGWVSVPGLSLTLGTDTSPGILHMVTNGSSWMRLNFTYTSGGSGNILNAYYQGVTT